MKSNIKAHSSLVAYIIIKNNNSTKRRGLSAVCGIDFSIPNFRYRNWWHEK